MWCTVITLTITTAAALLLAVFNTVNTTDTTLTMKLTSLIKRVKDIKDEIEQVNRNDSSSIEALQSKLQLIDEELDSLRGDMRSPRSLPSMSNSTAAELEEANTTLVSGPVYDNCVTTSPPQKCIVDRNGLRDSDTGMNDFSECHVLLRENENEGYALRDVKCYVEFESQLVNPTMATLIYDKDMDMYTWSCRCTGIYANTSVEFQNFNCFLAATWCPMAPLNFVEVGQGLY